MAVKKGSPGAMALGSLHQRYDPQRVVKVKAQDLVQMLRLQKYRGGFEGLQNRLRLEAMLDGYGLTKEEKLQCL